MFSALSTQSCYFGARCCPQKDGDLIQRDLSMADCFTNFDNYASIYRKNITGD